MAFSFDLPTVWAFIISFAIFAYVVMDGFDLGIGILFPTLEEGRERDTRMLAVMVKTLRELHAIDGAHGKGKGKGDAALEPANDDTRDINEFRRDLARKIDQLAAQYSEEGDRGA